MLSVPAQTWESGCLDTGKDSPVRVLSSTSLRPSTTTPSIGMTSPALTAITVLTFTSRAATTSPVSARIAFCGAMLIRADIPATLWLALVSSHSAVVKRKTMNPASE
ncbi:Os06g0700601 [Oryza sativa Japonica Group]|uniref:Os06g0700601 protein n=1 Tax=Oryza sativa subsp. japonica TaxID=39947 RepID=A0A0P0X0L2_ORYSJ|nr:hypothetical protein EE612_036307 [Oryza sativa]BAS99339.1 Os06g0700601 [Oryza sativa Japonica Group]